MQETEEEAYARVRKHQLERTIQITKKVLRDVEHDGSVKGRNYFTLRRARERLFTQGYDFNSGELPDSKYLKHIVLDKRPVWAHDLIQNHPLTPLQRELIIKINESVIKNREIPRTDEEFEANEALKEELIKTKFDWSRPELMKDYLGKQYGEADTTPLTAEQLGYNNRINVLVDKRNATNDLSLPEFEERLQLMHKLNKTGYDWRRTEVHKINR